VPEMLTQSVGDTSVTKYRWSDTYLEVW